MRRLACRYAAGFQLDLRETCLEYFVIRCTDVNRSLNLMTKICFRVKRIEFNSVEDDDDEGDAWFITPADYYERLRTINGFLRAMSLWVWKKSSLLLSPFGINSGMCCLLYVWRWAMHEEKEEEKGLLMAVTDAPLLLCSPPINGKSIVVAGKKMKQKKKKILSHRWSRKKEAPFFSVSPSTRLQLHNDHHDSYVKRGR